MEQNGKTEKTGDPSPPSDDDQDTRTKLLSETETSASTRKSEDAGIPKDHDQAKRSSSLKELRRVSRATVWHIQKPQVPENAEIRVYKRRWFMMIIVLLFGIVGALQWAMYAIIANVITKYYKVSNRSVDFTGLVFLITFILTFLPLGWILDNMGLRWSMLLGNVANVFGCLLRVLSVPPDRFWLTMLGQTVVGVSQVFITMIPVRIAAVWFPANEVSFACSLAYNGLMLGTAVGFILPPLLVRNSDDMEQISSDLNTLYIGVAVFAFFVLILSVFFFQEKPPLPPSPAQKHQLSLAAEKDRSLQEFANTLKRLMKKKSYLILMISFSLNVGVYCAICTLLNQVLIPHFPGREQEIGLVGLLLVVSGVGSTLVCGFILDRTHAFRMTIQSLYALALIGWIAFSVFIHVGNLSWVLIATFVLGFAQGNQPVAIDFGVEITYPEPEGIASGLLCAVVQVFGIVFTLIYGYMLEAWGDAVANGLMVIPLILGSVILMFMRPTLKRQAQQRKSLQHLDVPKPGYTGV